MRFVSFFSFISYCLSFTLKRPLSPIVNQLGESSSTKLNSLNSKYDLVIWDCDGVLVDSEALLKQGEVEALAKAGFQVTVEECIRMFSGVSGDKAAENFLATKKAPLPDHFIRDQVAGSMSLFRERLQPLMRQTIHQLFNKNVRLCVASGSPRDRVLLCLEVGQMSQCFKPEEVFTREQVKKGKPAPDLFLYAAEQMGVLPNRCIVVEDAPSGIEAAQAAGMACIGFLGGGHAQYDWYRSNINKYQIPLAYTQEEVFDKLINSDNIIIN